jgi:hypothetical protein
MPDITMCPEGPCPWRMNCYRYRATPSFWQAYFTDQPYDNIKRECIHFDKILSADLIARERKN